MNTDPAGMSLLERLAAAADPSSRVELLARLASDEHLGVREAVARNTATPLPLLLRLCGWFPQAVMHNPRYQEALAADPELWRQLTESSLVALLRQPEAPPSWLAEGARHPSFWPRQAVAQHPLAPVEALHALAEDAGLRPYVARNPSLPAPLLSRLAQDADPQVRATVAGHPGASDATQAWLAQDRASEVRCALAHNPRCDAGLLGQLAADEDPEVRRAAARNPALPAEALALLQRAGSSADLAELAPPDETLEPEVLAWLAQGGTFARMLAARHPCTPADALLALRADGNAEVRSLARRGTPSLPPAPPRTRGTSLPPLGRAAWSMPAARPRKP